MKRFIVLLLLLCFLCGCTDQTPLTETAAAPALTVEPELPVPVPEPQKDPVPPVLPAVASQPLYLYESESRACIIDPAGDVVLESEHRLSLLRDNSSGQICGIAEQGSEGICYDEYGWAQPEHRWCRLYDLQGQLITELPTDQFFLCSGWLICYGSESTSIYRLSDGVKQFQNVLDVFPMESLLTFRQDSSDAPITILCPDGSTFLLPADVTVSFARTDTDGTVYLVVYRDQHVGLMNLQGELLVNYYYKDIPAIQNGIAYLVDTLRTDCFSLAERTVLQTWPVHATSIYPNCAIAQQGNNREKQCLVDLNGQLLNNTVFDTLSSVDVDQDGQPELFKGTRSRLMGQDTLTTHVLLAPDGTILSDTLPDDGILQPLDTRFVLHSNHTWNDAAQSSHGIVTLLDLQTGQNLAVWEGTDVYTYPLYYMGYAHSDALSHTCFLLSRPNNLGWSRMDLLAPNGAVLLEQLSSVVYRGGGVLQVQQGFTSGLIRPDGTWLYQESRFSAIEG